MSVLLLVARCSGMLFKWFCDKSLLAKDHQNKIIWPSLYSNFKLYWILAIVLRNIDLWSCHFRHIFCCLCCKGFTRHFLCHDFIAEKNFNFRHKSSHTMQKLVKYVKLLQQFKALDHFPGHRGFVWCVFCSPWVSEIAGFKRGAINGKKWEKSDELLTPSKKILFGHELWKKIIFFSEILKERKKIDRNKKLSCEIWTR